MWIKEKLKKKGWTEKEIAETVKITREAKKNKHPAIKFLDKAVYWISLLIAIIGNGIISIVLMPFLMTLKSFQLYLVVVTIGISFGLLFELLIRSIVHLKTKHHLFFGFFIPLVAIINVFIITNIVNNLGNSVMIKNAHNPLIVSVVYGVVFILPYAVYHLFLEE
ncbi:hypothetical protein ISS05_01645 [Candidatus Woesearchaeota archaeon]|nr:hypothetical protein [Candidatus Woesearchaeota archaeon]